MMKLYWIDAMTHFLAMKKCCSNFVVIDQPIITCDEIDGLMGFYKNEMRNHYHTMHLMIGFKKNKVSQKITLDTSWIL